MRLERTKTPTPLAGRFDLWRRGRDSLGTPQRASPRWGALDSYAIESVHIDTADVSNPRSP